MHLALTKCPDALIRKLAACLPVREVTLGALPPGEPGSDGDGTRRADAILTAPCRDTGCEHIRWLRCQYPGVPILVVTDDDDTDAVVRAFQAGADAVVKGSPDPAELRLRLRALATHDGAADDPFRYGALRLDRLRHAAEGPAGSVHLTPREYQILGYLMRQAEQVVTRGELGRAVWWDESDPPTGNLLDVHLSHVRCKLEEAGTPGLLHTVRGIGFIFGTAEQPGARRPA